MKAFLSRNDETDSSINIHSNLNVKYRNSHAYFYLKYIAIIGVLYKNIFVFV